MTLHSDEVMSEALKDYADPTRKTKDIAAKYNVSASTLTVWARKAGIQLRGRGRDRNEEPDARTRAILEAAAALKQEEVAARFGITKQRISKIMKRWKGWKKPSTAPFAVGDVIEWNGAEYTVLEAQPLFGVVRDSTGDVINPFYWNMRGFRAHKVEPHKRAA